jgi:hypothetical protein
MPLVSGRLGQRGFVFRGLDGDGHDTGAPDEASERGPHALDCRGTAEMQEADFIAYCGRGRSARSTTGYLVGPQDTFWQSVALLKGRQPVRRRRALTETRNGSLSWHGTYDGATRRAEASAKFISADNANPPPARHLIGSVSGIGLATP